MKFSFGVLVLLASISLSVQRKRVSVHLLGDRRIGNEGYLGYFFGNLWYYMCDEYWGNTNSKVVCRELGFSKVLYNATKRDFNTRIEERGFLFQQIYCEGHESRLADCPSKLVFQQDFNNACRKTSRVYVTCSPTQDNEVVTIKSTLTQSLAFRLYSGDLSASDIVSGGNLQFKILGEANEKWKNLCSDGWTEENAYIACLTLGFNENEPVRRNTRRRYREEEQFVRCTGSERSLLECTFRRRWKQQCLSMSAIRLSCLHRDQRYLANHIRLRGGYRRSEGRVEIFDGRRWGTICDDGWDINDASVVCKELGFGSAFEATHWADHGEGLGPIHITNMNCRGNEKSIDDCRHSKSTGRCTHSEDAGVRCHVNSIVGGEVRLIGGKSIYEGHIQLLLDGEWKAICGVGFSQREGAVVCRELGLGFVKWADRSDSYGLTYIIGRYDVKCKGDEASIKDCAYKNASNCRYYDMASVICSRYASDLVMDINAFQNSIKVEGHDLNQLQCSYEERCLAPIVYRRRQDTSTFRHLMKFTSRFMNKGSAIFMPNVKKDNWIYHSCHKHYHSMEVFAIYDLIDSNGHPVAEGHKASFCLEDTECDHGYRKTFNCTNKGTQGISVNCADNYKNTIDCQWIDITEVGFGNYTLRILANPNKDVGETDHFNNRAVCELHYYDYQVQVLGCSADPCYEESFGGSAFGHCCHFPFIYRGRKHYECIRRDERSNRMWCGTTVDFDRDGKWGYCK